MKFFPVFFCLLLTPGFVFGTTPDSATGQFINDVQELLFNDKYQAAESLCTDFIKMNPKHPVGYLFLAGTFLGDMSDREEPSHSGQFRKLIDTAIIQCDSVLDSAKVTDAAYSHLWRGHAHAYRSLFESRFGSLTSAVKHGLKARDDYQNGLLHDPTLYDLYFGLGNYHFWKSVRAGILRTIGLINNDTQKGIAELRLAADSGKYFRNSAINSELWIWLEQKEYDRVLIQGFTLLKFYPHSRTLRWPIAEAGFQSKQYRVAAELYIYLRDYFDNNRGNYFNLIECDYRLYLSLQKLNKQDEADEILKRVGEYRNEVPRATQRRQLAKLNFLRRELKR